MKETSEIISKNAFKCYLGVIPEVTNWDPTQTEFSLIFETNPLAENVELPPKMDDLWYSNVLAGIIKGALEMVFLEVDSYFIKDQLRGDNYTEIRIKLINKTTPLIPHEE
uniref:Trafficking protein particle complex subunit 3 (Trinotate prediction) n=1 Tax=Myxobolus squamalis TaxID=59785 RepID=A0A6B2FZ39_MYXSQ